MVDAAVLRLAGDRPARPVQYQWGTIPLWAVGRRRVGADARASAAAGVAFQVAPAFPGVGAPFLPSAASLRDAEGRGEGGMGGAASAVTGLVGPATPVYPCWISGQRLPARMAWRLSGQQGRAWMCLKRWGTIPRWSRSQPDLAVRIRRVVV